LPTGPIHYT